MLPSHWEHCPQSVGHTHVKSWEQKSQNMPRTGRICPGGRALCKGSACLPGFPTQGDIREAHHLIVNRSSCWQVEGKTELEFSELNLLNNKNNNGPINSNPVHFYECFHLRIKVVWRSNHH